MVSLSKSILLNVVEHEGKSFGLLSVLSDGNGGSASHLSWVTLNVVLAESEPLTEVVTGLNIDKRNSVLLSQGGDKLLVFWVFAVGGEHANKSLVTVKALANLVESLDESVVSMGLLDNTLDGILKVVNLLFLLWNYWGSYLLIFP